MTVKEYEAVKAMRVSEIVALTSSSLYEVIKKFTIEKPLTEPMKFGTLIHSMLLTDDRDAFPYGFHIVEAENFVCKKGREGKEKGLKFKKIPILRKQYENALQSLEKAMPVLDKYFDPAKCEFEKPFFANDEVFGEIKGRLDAIYDNRVVNDLKVSSSFGNLDKKIYDMGYQVQMYLYMELSGLEESNLVFFDPENSIIQVKHLPKAQIQKECEVLLKRAVKNKKLLDEYLAGELRELLVDDYQIPQWALTDLAFEDNKE